MRQGGPRAISCYRPRPTPREWGRPRRRLPASRLRVHPLRALEGVARPVRPPAHVRHQVRRRRKGLRDLQAAEELPSADRVGSPLPAPQPAMTSQGSAHGRFTRAIQQRNLWAAETSRRELRTVSLDNALGYLDLLAEQKPEKLERACVRWHGRLGDGVDVPFAGGVAACARSVSEPLCRGARRRSKCCGDYYGVCVPRWWSTHGSVRLLG
jgi:hypothetical protein